VDHTNPDHRPEPVSSDRVARVDEQTRSERKSRQKSIAIVPEHADATQGNGDDSRRMKGGVRASGAGTWEYYVTVTNIATGHPTKSWRTFRGTWEDAQEKRKDDQKEADKRPQSPRNVKLSQAIDEWLAFGKPRFSKSTLGLKQDIARVYLMPVFGRDRLTQITAPRITRFYTDLLTYGRPDGAQPRNPNTSNRLIGRPRHPLSPAGVDVIHRQFKALLNFAKAQGYLGVNPMADRAVAKPEYEAYVGNYLNSEQMVDACLALSGSELGEWAAVAMATGLRRGEILGLSAESVNVGALQLSVSWAVDGGSDPPELKRPKTRRSRRTVPIDAATASFLTDLSSRAMSRPANQPSEPRAQPVHLLWANADGSPLCPGVATSRWRTWAHKESARLQIPVVRFHDLRDSYATCLLEAGIPLEVVSENLGHGSVLITAQRYARVTERMRRRAADVPSVLARMASNGLEGARRRPTRDEG
jgi:integrase